LGDDRHRARGSRRRQLHRERAPTRGGVRGLEVPFARSPVAARAVDDLVADLQRATLALSVESNLVTAKSVHTRVLQDEPEVVADAIVAIRART
jgi:hypothetical protein